MVSLRSLERREERRARIQGEELREAHYFIDEPELLAQAIQDVSTLIAEMVTSEIATSRAGTSKIWEQLFFLSGYPPKIAVFLEESVAEVYRPVVYRLALMQRTLVERFPQEYTQFVEANRREVARFVSQTFIDRAKFPRLAYPALDGFLPPFINPLTAWFTQHLFQGTVQEFHAWLLELQAKGESW